jgi:2-polyprenyl-3-methyl-5-hydroxy-6-metoxy-1,4-benzoquinol methylase
MIINCTICGSHNIRNYGKTNCIDMCDTNGVNIKRYLFKCIECDSINIYPIPSNELLMKYYNNYAIKQATSQWNNRAAIPIITDLCKNIGTGKVLDIGCGNGSLLDLLPSSLEKYGVEIAESAAGVAKTKDIKVSCLPWELVEYEGLFDLIIALDFLEHVANPWDSFKKMANFLKPGGFIVIETGNADSFIARSLQNNWSYTAVFGHLCTLSHKALISYAEKANIKVLKIIKINHFSINIMDGFYRGLLAYGFHILKIIHSRLAFYQIENKYFRNLDNYSPIQAPLRDHMILVGQKKSLN